MPKLLLLGTGGIAGHHVSEFGQIKGHKFVACVDPIPGRAKEFAKANGIGKAFESLEQALDWGQFDAASNCTPDGVHKVTTLALVAAGKHVFCEKPLAQNYEDALAMTEAAEKACLMNMVNLTYRNSPAIQRAKQMVEAGEIGDLRHVEASYRQGWLVGKHWGDWRTGERWLWRLSTKHGSAGVLGDVGVHILDFASYGACQDIVGLKADMATFPKADGERIGEYRLDANDSVVMTAKFANGALGTILATRYATGHANDLTLALHGTKGALRVETTGHESSLMGCLGKDIDKNRWKKIEMPPVKRNAVRFAEALKSGVNGDPSFRRAADIQKVIDATFKSAKTKGVALV
ncbi:MAG TPA: Gfo/Idh/MocA family oxidoreductase [Rhizobiaceae bacterium]|nr:Gfo/Idh/MocA family oxidoreductase [Rhizobiaceae bacterium]